MTRRLPRWTVQGKEAATEKQYFNEDDEKLMRVRLHFTQSRMQHHHSIPNATSPGLSPLAEAPRKDEVAGGAREPRHQER